MRFALLRAVLHVVGIFAETARWFAMGARFCEDCKKNLHTVGKLA